MPDQNGNGAEAPQTGPKFSVLAQYTKDLSFENPNAPRTLGPQQTAPNISIQINVNARQLAPHSLLDPQQPQQRDHLLLTLVVVLAVPPEQRQQSLNRVPRRPRPSNPRGLAAHAAVDHPPNVFLRAHPWLLF